MPVLGVSYFWNTSPFNKLLQHFCLLTPFWSSHDSFCPLLIELFKDINSLRQLICIDFLFLFSISRVSLLFSFWSLHNNGLIIRIPKCVDLFLDSLLKFTKHRRYNVSAQPFVSLFQNVHSFSFDRNVFFLIEKFDNFWNVRFQKLHSIYPVNRE